MFQLSCGNCLLLTTRCFLDRHEFDTYVRALSIFDYPMIPEETTLKSCGLVPTVLLAASAFKCREELVMQQSMSQSSSREPHHGTRREFCCRSVMVPIATATTAWVNYWNWIYTLVFRKGCGLLIKGNLIGYAVWCYFTTQNSSLDARLNLIRQGLSEVGVFARLWIVICPVTESTERW